MASAIPTFAGALLAAQAAKRSGVFAVRGEGSQTHVYFADGLLVFAEQGTLGDTLGRVLVREGKLTTDQYAEAIRRMTEQITDSEQMRFGEVVVELGFLTLQEVHEALAIQVRQKAIRCLMYEAPEWTFHEDADRLGIGHFPSTVEPLILAAAKVSDAEALSRVLDLDEIRYPRLLQPVDVITAKLALNVLENRFVSEIDGRVSTHVVLRNKHHGLEHAEAILAALVLSELAELSLEPTGARPERAASPAPPAVTVPAPPLLDAPSFTVPAPPPLPRLRSSAKASAGVSLKTPVVTLTPRTPLVSIPHRDGHGHKKVAVPPSGPRASAFAAEAAFQKAKQALGDHALPRALPELRTAVALCPDMVEYRVYLGWAEFTDQAHEQDAPTAADTRKALKSLAVQSIKHDPGFAFGFFVLGQLAMLDGEAPNVPIRLLRHALKLDPKLLDAEGSLRVATMRAARPAVPDAPHEDEGASVAAQLFATFRSTVAHPRVAEPPAASAPAVPAPAAPVLAAPALPAPEARRKSPLPLALAFMLVAVTSGALGVWYGTQLQPEARALPPSPSSSVSIAFSRPVPSAPSASAPSSPAPMAPAPSQSTAPFASAPPSSPPAPSASADTDPTFGTLRLPVSALGHRVFVDGRVVGVGAATLRVPCGSHAVKVGSSGAEKTLEIPCLGSIDFE